MAPLAMVLIVTIRDVSRVNSRVFALQRVCMDASIGIDLGFDRGQSLKLTVYRGNWLHLNGRFVSFSSLRVQFDCMSSIKVYGLIALSIHPMKNGTEGGVILGVSVIQLCLLLGILKQWSWGTLNLIPSGGDVALMSHVGLLL